MAGALFYGVLRVIIHWWARWYLRLEVVGREHVPAEGGLLVAGNHISYLDIPMMACALGRPADFMGKRELFHHPVIGWIYRWLGGFPIRRGGVTKEALNEAVLRIQAGRVVVIYPEGGINLTGELLPPKPGVGVIVARTGVAVLPAYVTGTDEAMPRGARWIRPRRVTVRLGPPMRFPLPASISAGPDHDGTENGEEERAYHIKVSHKVMDAIKQLRRQSRDHGQAPVRDAGRSDSAQSSGERGE
ncbi:MAG TPA: lysophospholipid acyltransferase family protein [Nitrospiria bacterium]|nr:lysophospholipid acyltransferase family protein [Nitrospiria bacterium]